MKVRNPRRVVHDVIKTMNSNIRTMAAEWSDAGWTQLEGAKYHTRATGEAKIENDARRWETLALYMKAIEESAAEVREYALKMQERVNNGERF